jgi:hypothetical protein
MKRIAIPAAGAAVLAALLLAACRSGQAPVVAVTVQPSAISPNADGVDDLARITYTAVESSTVSIYLTDAAGRRYDLRAAAERPASPRPYELLFNGVSGGRLMADGVYTWHLEAASASGTAAYSGLLTIAGADVPFPEIEELTLSSPVFSPNRDGIDDRVYVNVGIAQPARLTVYVSGADGFRYDVPRREGQRAASIDGTLPAGRYGYDYDGGIDLGADPPPNGDYILTVETEDAAGQRDTLTASLAITHSGRPMAEIVVQPDGSAVRWSRAADAPPRDPNDTQLITVGISETIHFTMAVRNTGLVPIRTAGPFDPDDCYRMEENRYTKGFPQEPGVFRVGVDFETNTAADHPWRWAIGTLGDLDVVLRDGVPLYYLAPGNQALVRGCVRITRVPVRNPFYLWASLIHEEVEIAAINNRVSPVLIQVIAP